MLPYLVMWTAILLFGSWRLKNKNDIKAKRAFLLFSFLLMLLLQSMRSLHVGADTKVYYVWFRQIKMLRWSDLQHFRGGDVEYGWLLLNKLASKLFGGDFQILLLLTSLLILINIGIFIYYSSEDVLMSVSLFLGLGHFLTAMSSLRQYIAIAFVLNVYTAMEKKKPLIAVLLAAVAYYFHKSSLAASVAIIGLFILIKKRKGMGNIYLALITFAGVLSLLLISNIELIGRFIAKYMQKYSIYFSADIQSGGSGKLDMIYLLIELLLIIFVVYKGRSNIKLQREILLILVAAAIILLQSNIDHIWRMGFYFNIFLIIVIPNTYNHYLKNNQSKMVIKGGIIASSVLLFLYLVLSSRSIYTYEFWFQY
ncbi:MAG: EpsG family protein [Lachnospiraceae bacterium]|nr:EpsG family protein [Lachnospiraceae bacterium]